MKDVAWLGVLAVLLGAIAWYYAGARQPPPAPPSSFQVIVDDLTKTLLPLGGTTLSSVRQRVQVTVIGLPD